MQSAEWRDAVWKKRDIAGSPKIALNHHMRVQIIWGAKEMMIQELVHSVLDICTLLDPHSKLTNVFLF